MDHDPSPFPAAPNLRVLLRERTRAAHERLDALIATLDLQAAEGRDGFSRLQYRGLLRLGRACGWRAAEATGTLRRSTEMLAPRYEAEAVGNPADPALRPDAVAYVALGSQLGLATLGRALAAHQRTGIFALAPDLASWTAFSRRAQSMPPDGAEAEAIVDDARRAFGIFMDEARHLVPNPAEHSV